MTLARKLIHFTTKTMRPTTIKTVQVHFQCICGYNEVYPDDLKIKSRELAKYSEETTVFSVARPIQR
jgi:hypothetical protein